MVAALALEWPVIVGFLPEALVAFAFLLVVFAAAVLFEKPIVGIFSQIPLIGGQIANAVSIGLQRATAWATGWVGQYVWPLIQWVIGIPQAVVGFISATTAAIEYTMDQLRILANATSGRTGLLGRQISSLSGSINAQAIRLAAAAATAAGALGLAQLLRSTTIPQARAQAVAQAEAYTAARVTAEQQARAEAVAQARIAAAALVTIEAHARQSGDAQVAATAAAAAAAIRAALAQLSTHVRTETDVRVGSLENELTQVRTRTIPAEVARATAAESALVAELTIAQEALRCLSPLCGSGYANLVGQLLQGAELLLLLELVGEAVRDPQGAAREMAGVVGGIEGVVSGFLAPFVGRA